MSPGPLLPYRVEARAQRLDLLEPADDLDFGRPFWFHTMRGVEAEIARGERRLHSLTFEQLAADYGSTAPAPAAMIFHIGRCGSTLVSRMVGHDPSLLVLRESPVIGNLHRGSAGNQSVPTFTLEAALTNTLRAFEVFAGARDQRVVVKHSSWESHAMGRMAELFPATPLVFIHRDPVDMVRSTLHSHPGWAPRLHEPLADLRRWVPWVDRVTPPFTAAAVYASVWASGVAAALAVEPGRVLFIDHRQLVDDPAAVVSALAEHLDAAMDRAGALSELDQYSKAESDGVAFDPDGRHHRPPLAPRVSAQVRDVVGDLPTQLAERTTGVTARGGAHDPV